MVSGLRGSRFPPALVVSALPPAGAGAPLSLGRQQSGRHWRRAVHGGRGPSYHSGSRPPGFSGHDLRGVPVRRRGPTCSSRPPFEPAAGAGRRVTLWLPSRAGGVHPPCLGGWGPGPLRLAGWWGGGGVEEGRPWDRDWGAVPDPLGEETLPLVGEVYGWLCWANQGTSRRSRNQPFDAVLLRRDGGNREVPPGGWAAPEDHERVLRSVIRAAWPDREPTWPAFLEGGAVLRITDADANNWLPRALRSALAHWRYRRHNPPPPQPSPHTSGGAGEGPDGGYGRVGGGGWAPRPTPPPRYGTTYEGAPPPAVGSAETTSAGGNLLPRNPLTTNR